MTISNEPDLICFICRPIELKVKVIGIGNPLASDDAIGLHVARKLLEMKLPDNVGVIAAESGGSSILELMTGADKVILIDATLGGARPGTVHRLSLDDIQVGKCKLRSLHEINLADLLRIGRLAQPEAFPRKLTIVGIEVANTGRYRQGLSDAVRDAIPRAVETVLSEIMSGFASRK